ncbi:hypothetical protein ACLB2K_042785 [Fragaria x ananassa]
MEARPEGLGEDEEAGEADGVGGVAEEQSGAIAGIGGGGVGGGGHVAVEEINDDDDQNSNKGVIMGSTTAVGASRLMEKPGQEQLQQQQQALKCPRCDSSNTKFCYYNNYSLSQPRHFCKACKRYWTRGGTLRNVPVGGGCRKNKRVKRPSSASAVDNGASSSASSAPNSGNNSNPNPQIDLASNSNHHHMKKEFLSTPEGGL